ncbi:hypothetical protein PTSG_01407 [Salpingoeca rosetta]|uniref:Aminoglycoside phosphotransferase domain-containing protein n=1 Tax=Salpingoeca rosetta (strain ATCC 50818 / BSB-021) TaxID=946362 RepID=F2U093_SALR5|nr:uncharacterized protein PTSG_01407 [Salpingoeca rosetta]EGD80821.1 hypothetical protein PTSG_01407 [Salpingoeca rosetta]|eukprot:XP_004997382.1 hypothetical protein PTSG_01407 [Salpingoeca rosetta]
MEASSQREVIDFLSTATAYREKFLGPHWSEESACVCSTITAVKRRRSSAIAVSNADKASKGTLEEELRPIIAALTDKDVTHTMTHTSYVFLVGDRLAFKLERAVKYPFLDMSTLPKRRIAVLKELCLNRSTSPEIYLGVVAVCKNEGGQLFLVPLRSCEPGVNTVTLQEEEHQQAAGQRELAIVDFLVEMLQFKQEDILDEVAKRGELTHDMMEQVVDQAVLFHRHARVHHEAQYGSDAMAWITKDNLTEMCEFASDTSKNVDADLARSVCERCVKDTSTHSALLAKRLEEGKVRFCHGDLHLKNMVLLSDRRPRLFDCIEFNDDLAITDVLYDIAFLLMDLLHRGLHSLANITLNRYIQKTHDIEGLALLPLFLATRAIIRAKVSCAQMSSESTDEAAMKKLQHRTNAYLHLAQQMLGMEEPSTMCVALGGFSGSGKSAVARLLACDLTGPIGAVVLRSDVVRKHMWNVDLLDRLPDGAYTDENRHKCYKKMAELAQQVMQAGFPVVLDATYTTDEQRQSLDALSTCQRVWLDADLETRAQRIARRDTNNADASDMTVDKLKK